MSRVFINLLRRLCLAFLKKHPMDLSAQMSPQSVTSDCGSHTKENGVNISPVLLYLSRKRTGQVLEHGHGITSVKSQGLATSLTTEEHIAKRRMRNARKKNTMLLRRQSQASTGKSSEK